MKRKLRKLFRFFLVFLSVISVCGCLCATAFADHVYDGSSYVYSDFATQSDSVILDWAVLQAEGRGYDCSGPVEDWSQSLIDYLESLGVDMGQASGYYVPGGHSGGNSTHGGMSANTVQDYEINYQDDDIVNFLNDLKDFDVTSVVDSSSAKDKFYKTLLWPYYSTIDKQNIEDYLSRINSYSARGSDNLKSYLKFKNFGLARGSYTDISGVDVESNNWGVPVNIFIRPHIYFDPPDYDGSWFTGMPALTSPTYVNTTSVSFTGSPYDIYGYEGSLSYYNGLVSLQATITDNTGFDVAHDMVRFDVKLEGLYNKGQVALTSDYAGATFFTPISNCSIDDQGLITPTDSNNGIIEFYVHCNSASLCSFKIWTYNFSSGGVTAPSQPIYLMPDPTDPNYETEKQQYDYFLTETDRLFDEYDINSFMNDIRNTFDDTPWLFYPIEFYNEVATVLTDNYSDTFDFTLEEMNFSSIADGFVIPHKEFHFDPDNLPNTVKALFRLFQWVLTFSYFWALIIWGRSLILRFGSDSTHIDYEDN